MMKPSHNYAELDKFPFNWRAERLALAQSAGYGYISQYLIETYRKTKSQRVTGRLCGGISGRAVGLFLAWAGEPRNGFGGPNKAAKVEIEVRGQMMTIRQIAEMTGLTYHIIRMRIYRGWPVEQILIPKRFRNRKRQVEA